MCTVEPIRNKDKIREVEEILLRENKRNWLIFVTGINFGLRISDLLSLNVCDVRGKDFIVLREQKTKKIRKIPINARLKPILMQYTKNMSQKDPLFQSYRQKRLDRITCWRMISDACRHAGIRENIGTHTLRKTFGYHHYRQYKDVALLQKIFNHSSPDITLRYIGIAQDDIFDSYTNFIL